MSDRPAAGGGGSRGDGPEQARDLALYHFVGCPYCTRVTRALRELGVAVEMRDIRAEPAHRARLVRARGRATVPVLLITDEAGAEQWMPESLDIVAYLRRRFSPASC